MFDSWNDFKKLSGINYPFDYLILNCIQKSKNRDIPVYWDLFYVSCNRYGLVDNKKYIQDKPKFEYKSIERIQPRPYANITIIDKSNPFFAELQQALKNMENSSTSSDSVLY